MSSITCLTDPTGLKWNKKILEKFNFSKQIFPRLVKTGTLNGFTTDAISEEIGQKIKVINTAGHDTAAALAILPDLDPNDCFISIGTTIMVGSISNSVYMTKKAFNHGYRNSAGPFGSNLLRINITGFWIVNEILKQLRAENKEITFDELENLAAKADGGQSFIDPKKNVFKVQNTDMISAVKSFCKESGQCIPEDLGAVIRCVLESYAMRIKYSLNCLKEIIRAT